MTDYILPHDLTQEEDRLVRMARMLDPVMRMRLAARGLAPGWRCLEVAAGIGSIGAWLAGAVGPAGHVVVSDIDTRFIDRLQAPNLSVRRIDLTRDDLGAGFDLVCGRAFLHHLPGRHDVLGRLAEAVKPGGVLLVEEPDFHPVLATENRALRGFWEGFLAWAADRDIDYFVGRRLGGWMAELGLQAVEVRGETIRFEGGSDTATYWRQTFEELADPIRASGRIARADWDEAMRLFDTPGQWMWQCCFLTASGVKPAG